MLTSIDPSMLSSSSIVHVVQLRKYSPNNRCRPSSCLLAVLAMFLAIISPRSYSWNEWDVRYYYFHNQNNSTSSPCLLCQRCINLQESCTFVKRKILPNLVVSSWLWWIMLVLLANRNQGNIFEWIINPDLASTRFRIHSVFKHFHSGDRIQKVADSYAWFTR